MRFIRTLPVGVVNIPNVILLFLLLQQRDGVATMLPRATFLLVSGIMFANAFIYKL